MRRKLLTGTVLALCLLLFAPSALAASAEVHRHPRESFALPITDASQLQSLGTDGAYLTADLSAAADIVISEDTRLCLNGYRLDMGEYSIKIAESGTLSIYDCAEDSAGICSSAVSDSAVIQNSGSFNLLSGTVSSQSRCVLLNLNICNVNGGLITGSADELVQTAGSALFTTGGGEIRALRGGSALCMIDASGAESQPRDYNLGISYCIVSAEGDGDGAVVLNSGEGRLVLNTGADVRGKGCPGVNVLAGNFDTYGGALVSSDTCSAIVGSGGNVSLSNSVINSTEKYGVDIGGEAKLLLSGSQDINGGLAGVHLADGQLFSMSDYGFYGDVRVSVYIDSPPDAAGESVAISTACEQKHTSHFLSANPRCSIVYSDGVIHCVYDESVSHYHDTQNYVLALDGSYSDLNKNNFYLADDLRMNGFYVGKTVNLCLNGHTLALSNAIKLYPGSTLNIHDCVGGGKIVSNNSCIQFLDGSANVVLYGGTLQSSGGPTIRLTHGSNVILKGGEIASEAEGGSAVEVSGLGGSISGSAGNISGPGAAVTVQDSYLQLSGEVKLSGGSYAVHAPGLGASMIGLDGSPVLEGGTADFLLDGAAELAFNDSFSPTGSYTLSRADSSRVIISGTASDDYSVHFTSTDEDKLIFNADGNALQLVSALPISPENAVCRPGECVKFTVSPDDSDMSCQWYIRRSGTGISESVSGMTGTEFESPALDAGEYDIYCRAIGIEDEYIALARLSVQKDEIIDVSVNFTGELEYAGDAQIPVLSTAGTTLTGRNVTFSYSTDGSSYSEQIPAAAPGANITIYYTASAEGCDDVKGTVQVFSPAAPESTNKNNTDQSSRKLTLLAMIFILFVLLIIYVLRFVLRKIRE